MFQSTVFLCACVFLSSVFASPVSLAEQTSSPLTKRFAISSFLDKLSDKKRSPSGDTTPISTIEDGMAAISAIITNGVQSIAQEARDILASGILPPNVLDFLNSYADLDIN